MTITARNTLLLSALLLALLIAGIVGYVIFHVSSHNPSVLLEGMRIMPNKPYNLTLLNTVIAVFFLLISLVAGYILKSYFRKSISEEIFFFILFVLFLSFEAVRVVHIPLILHNEPTYYGALVTRIILFGRIFSTLSLFFSGLFAAGLTYQKYGIFIGLAILIGFTFSGTVAIDTTRLDSHLMYHVGNQREVVGVLLGLKGISALNYFLGGYIKSNRDYLYMGLSVVILIAGLELIFRVYSFTAAITGFILITLGIVVFSNRIHSAYMWY
jgi:hypothetical protein